MNEACIDLYNQCITLYESAVLRSFCRRRAGLAQFFPPIKHRPIHIDLYEDLTLGRTDDLIFTARGRRTPVYPYIPVPFSRGPSFYLILAERT